MTKYSAEWFEQPFYKLLNDNPVNLWIKSYNECAAIPVHGEQVGTSIDWRNSCDRILKHVGRNSFWIHATYLNKKFGYHMSYIFGIQTKDGKWHTEPGFIPKTFTQAHKGHWVRQSNNHKWVDMYYPEAFNEHRPEEYSIGVPDSPANEFLEPKKARNIKVGDWVKCHAWTSWHEVTGLSTSGETLYIQGCPHRRDAISEIWPAENGDPNKFGTTTLRMSGSTPNISNYPKSALTFEDIKPGMWVKIKSKEDFPSSSGWIKDAIPFCGTWNKVRSIKNNIVFLEGVRYFWYDREIEAISEHAPIDMHMHVAANEFIERKEKQKGENMITQKDLDEMKNFDPENLKKVKAEVDKDFSTRQQQIAREKYQAIKNELEQVNLEIKNLSDRKTFLESAAAAFA